MVNKVHVMAGRFASLEDACLYTEKQWEPEPDSSVSDEEYEAWEDRNPSWKLREDLDVAYLSPDYIETLERLEGMGALENILPSLEDFSRLHSQSAGDNILVLIYHAAFDGRRANMASTPKLRYLGEFTCNPFSDT